MMKPRFFRALRMLGAFPVILVVALAIIVVSVFNAFLFGNSTDDLQLISKERERYQQARGMMLQLQRLERAYLIADQDTQPQVISAYETTLGQLDDLLVLVDEESGYEISVYQDPAPRITGYRNTLVDHFDLLVAESEDLGSMPMAESEIEQGMNEMLLNTSAGFNQQSFKINEDRQAAIMISLSGLIAFPVIALWSFALTSRLTCPLLELTNAATATGGRHYRPDMLDEVRARRDGLREVALAIDEAAQAVEARKVALQQEVETLQAELQAIRHQKMEQLDQKGAAQ